MNIYPWVWFLPLLLLGLNACAPPSFWIHWQVDRAETTRERFQTLQELCHGYDTEAACRAAQQTLCQEHHETQAKLALRALTLRRYEEARLSALQEYPACEIPTMQLQMAHLAESLQTCEGADWVVCERKIFTEELAAQRNEPGISDLLALRAERFCERSLQEFSALTAKPEPDPRTAPEAFRNHGQEIQQNLQHLALYCQDEAKEPAITWLVGTMEKHTSRGVGLLASWRQSLQWQLADPGNPRLDELANTLAERTGKALWNLALTQAQAERPNLSLLLIGTLQAYSLPIEPDWEQVRRISQERDKTLRQPVAITLDGEKLPSWLTSFPTSLKPEMERRYRWLRLMPTSMLYGENWLQLHLSLVEPPSVSSQTQKHRDTQKIQAGFTQMDKPELGKARARCQELRQHCQRCKASKHSPSQTWPTQLLHLFFQPETASFLFANPRPTLPAGPGLSWLTDGTSYLWQATQLCDETTCSHKKQIEACTIPPSLYAKIRVPIYKDEPIERSRTHHEVRLLAQISVQDPQQSHYHATRPFVVTMDTPSPPDEGQQEVSAETTQELRHALLSELMKPLNSILDTEQAQRCAMLAKPLDDEEDTLDRLERNATRNYLGCSLDESEKQALQSMLRDFLLTH